MRQVWLVADRKKKEAEGDAYKRVTCRTHRCVMVLNPPLPIEELLNGFVCLLTASSSWNNPIQNIIK